MKKSNSFSLPIKNIHPPSKVWSIAIGLLSFCVLIIGAALAVDVVQQALRTEKLSPTKRNNSTENNPPEIVGIEPRSLSIQSISVQASLVPLGLNTEGAIEVPVNPSDVGWYTGAPAPGQPGTAILVGHLDSTIGPAVFWNLKQLKPGDSLNIALSNGKVATYTVTSTANYSFNNFPDNQVYAPTLKPSLRLITCSGTYSRTTHHYSKNLVVYADLQDK